jgi:hypothetical protein
MNSAHPTLSADEKRTTVAYFCFYAITTDNATLSVVIVERQVRRFCGLALAESAAVIHASPR